MGFFNKKQDAEQSNQPPRNPNNVVAFRLLGKNRQEMVALRTESLQKKRYTHTQTFFIAFKFIIFLAKNKL